MEFKGLMKLKFLEILMQKILLTLIKFYQFFLSPMLGQNCKFHPTCSDYAKDAITIHGNFKGLALSIFRILRCQPFCKGGNDPVIKD